MVLSSQDCNNYKNNCKHGPLRLPSSSNDAQAFLALFEQKIKSRLHMSVQVPYKSDRKILDYHF